MSKADSLFDFPYQLRQSKKAKRMGINLSPEKGVEVVYPMRASEKGAIRFLQQQHTWVMKHRQVWEVNVTPISAPEQIVLAASAEHWPVHYEMRWVSTPKKACLLVRPDRSLVYIGKDDTQLIFRLLKRWCLAKAEQHLTTRIAALNRQTGLDYQQVIFRTQKTRWGSCSDTGAISLNTSLIFLAPPLVDYVIIHELAHTVHFDHSSAFWQLVARWSPEYHAPKKILRKKQTIIPAWFLQTR